MKDWEKKQVLIREWMEPGVLPSKKNKYDKKE
jgi:hypothetical protein